MDEPDAPAPGTEDVLSMGEGRSPRWGLLGALLAVLLLAVGAYQLVSRPSTPAAPQPAAAATEEQSGAALLQSGHSGLAEGRSAAGTSLRLGGHLVTLRGSGLAQPRRETSATTIGKLRQGWLVRVTSKACEDPADVQVSYGVAVAGGRFEAWNLVTTGPGTSWRSPDRSLRLVEKGSRLELRRTATGDVVARFPVAG